MLRSKLKLSTTPFLLLALPLTTAPALSAARSCPKSYQFEIEFFREATSYTCHPAAPQNHLEQIYLLQDTPYISDPHELDLPFLLQVNECLLRCQRDLPDDE